jgi:aminopeptidase N
MDVELITLKSSNRKVMKRPSNINKQRKVIRIENEDEVDSYSSIYSVYNSHCSDCSVPVKTDKKEATEHNKKYWENREAKIEYQKRYNAEVRDMKSYNKSYYEQHKDEIIERMTKRVTCSCGKTVTFGNLKSHYKTNLHKKKLKSISQ